MYSIHLTRNMDTTLTVLVSLWSIKFMWTFLLRGTRKPKNARLVGNISEIHIFPVKSMKGIQLSSAECLFQGLKYPKLDIIDRNFMVVDRDGKFLTARTEPKLTMFSVEVQGNDLVLSYPGELSTLKIPHTSHVKRSEVLKTSIAGEAVEGLYCGDEAASWVSKCLSKPGCRDYVGTLSHKLIYGAQGLLKRELNQQKDKWKRPAKDGDKITFHDNFPFNILSQASLEDLNSRQTHQKYTMSWFRPNFVVSGCKQYEQDLWDEVWIGEKAKFTKMKPCNRCLLVTVNPSTGTKHETEEPLTVLRQYRLNEPVFGRSPIFGINLVLDYSSGEDIKVGDPVFALSKD